MVPNHRGRPRLLTEQEIEAKFGPGGVGTWRCRMMADSPDFAILHSPGDLPRFTGFPHRIVLRPEGVSTAAGPTGGPCQ
jgi:hypothetical protein